MPREGDLPKRAVRFSRHYGKSGQRSSFCSTHSRGPANFSMSVSKSMTLKNIILACPEPSSVEIGTKGQGPVDHPPFLLLPFFTCHPYFRPFIPPPLFGKQINSIRDHPPFSFLSLFHSHPHSLFCDPLYLIICHSQGFPE